MLFPTQVVRDNKTFLGETVVGKLNFGDKWFETVESKQKDNPLKELITISKLPGKSGERVILGQVVSSKETAEPKHANMLFTAADLQRYATVGADGRLIPWIKSVRASGWGEGTPERYVADNPDDQFDRGHLLGNFVTGSPGMEDFNEVAMSSSMNREGSIRKAEEIAMMIAKNNPKGSVKYKIVPDYKNSKEVVAALPDGTFRKERMPSAFLVQVIGPGGTNTFHIPNSNDSMQEPTRYMVNKQWVKSQMPNVPEDYISSMPDEVGFKGQIMSYFKNVAGTKANKMPLKDAVKEAYTESRLFEEQIKKSKGGK